MHSFRILARYLKIAVVRLTHYRVNFVFVVLYWFASLAVMVVF